MPSYHYDLIGSTFPWHCIHHIHFNKSLYGNFHHEIWDYWQNLITLMKTPERGKHLCYSTSWRQPYIHEGAVVVMIEWLFDLQLPVQSVPIIDFVSSNPAHDEVYLIQHYVIKFVSDLRQVRGLRRVLQFSPPIKLTVMI
jgi:hypothetical protein